MEAKEHRDRRLIVAAALLQGKVIYRPITHNERDNAHYKSDVDRIVHSAIVMAEALIQANEETFFEG